eukprot:COSAG06_NODE_482_length_15147_cov_9.932815_6_plen_136_part_00
MRIQAQREPQIGRGWVSIRCPSITQKGDDWGWGRGLTRWQHQQQQHGRRRHPVQGTRRVGASGGPHAARRAGKSGSELFLLSSLPLRRRLGSSAARAAACRVLCLTWQPVDHHDRGYRTNKVHPREPVLANKAEK